MLTVGVRPLAFPAGPDIGGSFGKLKVGRVEVQRYEQVPYTRSGRIPASKKRMTGNTGIGEIRGGCSYGNFEGWTEDVIKDNR